MITLKAYKKALPAVHIITLNSQLSTLNWNGMFFAKTIFVVFTLSKLAKNQKQNPLCGVFAPLFTLYIIKIFKKPPYFPLIKPLNLCKTKK